MDNCRCRSALARIAPGLILAGVLFLTSTLGLAAEPTAGGGGATGNGTQITAERMEFQRQDNKVRFFEAVHVKRDSFELWCEKLTLHLAKGPQNSTRTGELQGRRDFEKIVAERNVRVRMNGRTARSNRAIYKTDPEVIILEGNATLRQERNVLRGRVVKFYPQDNRGEVIGGSEGRVEAVFYPSETEKRER